jgi:hypothetical protein
MEQQALEQLPAEEESLSFVPADFRLLQEAYQRRGKRKALKRSKIAEHYDDAFELIGGVPRLALWGHEDPGAFYKLHARLIPSEQKTEHNGEIRIVGFVQPTALDGVEPLEGEIVRD